MFKSVKKFENNEHVVDAIILIFKTISRKHCLRISFKIGYFVTFTWRNLENDEKPRKCDVRFKNLLGSIRKFGVQTRLAKSELATMTDR